MSDFFRNQETQRKDIEKRELREIGMGALIGALADAAISKYTSHPTNFIEFLPSLYGSIPGAAVAAAFLPKDEK